MNLRLLLCALLSLAAIWVAPAHAQNCSVIGSPELAFSTIPANPTQASTATVSMTVRCTRDIFQLDPVKVCVGLGAGADDQASLNPRRMRNGTALINYKIASGSQNGPLWGPLNGTSAGPISFTVDWDLFVFSKDVTVTAYGTVTAGQTALITGPYTANIPGTVASSTTTSRTCSALGGERAFTLRSTANIASTCTIVANNLNFGNSSNLLAGPINGSTSLGVNCTPGAPYTIKLNGGRIMNSVTDRRMALNGTGAGIVRYELFRDSGRLQPWGDGTSSTTVVTGTGNGSPITVPVYGRVPAQTTPSAGVYQDTVTVTVEY